jgi:uncharacterized protein with HEPN domain
MNERDRTRLQDMLNEAYRARKFLQGKSRTDLQQDEMLAYAVIRAIEIIGEAASQTTSETREIYFQLPWHNMIGMRNRLIHGYSAVDLDIVWEVVHRNLPALIPQLEQILATD